MVRTERQHLHRTVNDKMGKARNRKKENISTEENRKCEGQGQDKKKGLCLPQTKTYYDI